MKILSLGLDDSILNKDSALARRVVKYGGLVEKYDIIVPSQKVEKIELSGKATVYGSGGDNKLTRFYKILETAKKLSREEEPDVVTVQDQYYLALIGLRLSKKFKAGLEIQVHGFEKFYGLRRLIARYVLPRAHAVRCVSQRLKKQLVSEFGVKEEKITVVPIYVEARSQQLEVGNKRDNGEFIFLTVGRLAPVKNIGLQIEAMREVIKGQAEAKLWIVGDGAEKKNYELRIKNYELKNKVKLLGRQDNLEEYYRRADAFILTSDSEGWGLAAIEAAGHGLPIIMTEVGCAGEVIKNGASGLVIPVGDKQKLIESMLELMENAAWREQLADGARLAVNQLPTEEQTFKLYKKSWEKAVNGNMSAQSACLPARQGSSSGRKLLILTQKVDLNDGILGFMPGWIEEFAKYCERITVICLQKGEYDLPENVKILSLGKEKARSKIKYLVNFYKYIWQERKNYDIVFTHMNPEYVVLAGLFWKIWGKKIALWYTHKNVDAKLRLAEKLSDIIFTASARSFRLKSKKVNIMGHGIDVERFIPAEEPVKEKIILSVDRISPTKNQLGIIKLFAGVKEKVDDCHLYIVGAPALAADESYFNELKQYVEDHNLAEQVEFHGAIANKNMPSLYRQAKVFINLSGTGSLDKTVLEAMACNLPVVTTNQAFKNILPAENYGLDLEDAGRKVVKFLQQGGAVNYREIVVRGHSLKSLMAKIIKKLT